MVTLASIVPLAGSEDGRGRRAATAAGAAGAGRGRYRLPQLTGLRARTEDHASAEEQCGHPGAGGGGGDHRSSCLSRRQEATHGDLADRAPPPWSASVTGLGGRPTPGCCGGCRREGCPRPGARVSGCCGAAGAGARHRRPGHRCTDGQLHVAVLVADRQRLAAHQLVGRPPGSTVTRSSRPRNSSRKRSRGSSSGSTGRNDRPPWPDRRRRRARSPPKPQTSASQVPASAATCRPSDESCSRIADVGERGLHDVLVRQVRQPHLRGDDRLAARRQRRVADGDLLVVGEVAQLLLVGERVAAQEQREHEVGLLDHLLAVELQVRVVRVQRIVLLGRAREVPARLQR